MRYGRRGLRGGSSLACLLDEHGKKRNPLALPRLSYKTILAWADAHFQRTGAWPNCNSGSSLPRLLARKRSLHKLLPGEAETR